jgi:hypothetical protein
LGNQRVGNGPVSRRARCVEGLGLADRHVDGLRTGDGHGNVQQYLVVEAEGSDASLADAERRDLSPMAASERVPIGH